MQLKTGAAAPGGSQAEPYKTVRIAKSEFQEIPSVILSKCLLTEKGLDSAIGLFLL